MSISNKSFALFRRDMLVYTISIVTGAIIARVLGPTSMGIWLILLMIPSYSEAFGRLKLDIAAVYFLGKKRCSLGEMTFILNIVALICSAVIGIVFLWKIDLIRYYLFKNAFVPQGVFILMLLFVAFQFIGMNYSYLLIYLEDIKSYNNFSLIQQIVGPISAIIMLLLFRLGLFALILSMLISNVLAVLFAAWKIQKVEKMIPNFNIRIIKDLFTYSFSLYLGGIVGFLNTYISSLLVAVYLLPAQLAFFRMGQDRAQLLNKIPSAIGTMLYPRISKTNGAVGLNENLTILSYRISLITASFAAIIGIFLIKPIVFVLYGKDFLPLSISFWILIPGVVLSGATSVFNQYFLGIGRPKITLGISIVPLAFQIALGLIFIPIYGVLGAAFTTSITFIAVSLITILVFQRISKIPISRVIMFKRSDFAIIRDFVINQLKLLRAKLWVGIGKRKKALMRLNNKSNLRVGIIGPCPPPYGGVTRLIMNNLKNWKADKIEAFLIPHRIPDIPEPPEGAAFIDYRKIEETVVLPQILHYLKYFPITRAKYYLEYYKYNCALAKIIKSHNLNLLYAHHTDIGGLSAIIQSSMHKIPAVIVAYGQTWLVNDIDKKYQRMAKYVLKQASWVISTSEHCQKGALNLGANPSHSSVVYAGIDLEKYRPNLDSYSYRRKLAVPPESIVISILGLALRQKVDTFLEAIKLLKGQKEIVFMIGGVGNDFDYLKDKVKELNMPNVRLLGFVPESDLPYFYASTDILVAAPNTLTECMGQSIKEAMSCGRAVVVANIGGGPEAISHMENGLLFEPGNPEDLAMALKTLIADPHLRKKLGEKALQTAREKFDAKRCADQLLDVFNKLLEGWNEIPKRN